MQQQQNDAFGDWKRNFNIATWLCTIHQRAITIPMRRTYGQQALGTPCALAVVMMLLWSMATQDSLMWLWMALWFLCFMKRRIEANKMAKDGTRIHSQYDGWPSDAIKFGKTEKAAKMVVEPMLAGLMGGILFWVYGEQGWSPTGLPYFFLAGMFTLPMVEGVKQTIWDRRTQGMLDARIEQQQVMNDFRGKYGDF